MNKLKKNDFIFCGSVRFTRDNTDDYDCRIDVVHDGAFFTVMFKEEKLVNNGLQAAKELRDGLDSIISHIEKSNDNN